MPDQTTFTALRFAVVGTHNTGKTTVCHDVTGRLMRRGIRATMASEPSRTSRYLAAGIRDVAAQMELFAHTVANEIEASRTGSVVVCDRSLIDVLAYTDALPGKSTAQAQLMAEAMRAFADPYLSTYSGFFRTGWRFPMDGSSDPLRVGDGDFQQLIDQNIDRHLDRLGLAVWRLDDPVTAADEIEGRVLDHLGIEAAVEL